MRSIFLVLAAPLFAACPGTPPEGDGETSSSSGDTGASTTSPTEGSATQIMTTDNPTDTTAATSTPGTSTTGEPDSSTGDTGESTGNQPAVVVEGLSAPESILHDTAADVYLISNINGTPADDDDNGFISRVNPDGSIAELRWIDGGDADVELSAPKGMAIFNDTLYVADITRVHKFDRDSGVQLGTIDIPGAMFLNDLAVNPLGRVYVSDSDTDAIHVIDDSDAVNELLVDAALAGPNGLLFGGENLLVVTRDADQLIRVPLEGPQAIVLYTFAMGTLDGIVALDDGSTLVSSWQAQAVLKLSPDQMTVTTVVDGLSSPADFEVDHTRGMLLVPLLTDDRAEFYPL